ncbi:hypothetical protein ACSZNZ_17990 [Aeromonas caviae]|uniref:hypothetical protein n=1 Tax=Gammaproteobacteria TaxID=1236 RepID=UPI0037D75615
MRAQDVVIQLGKELTEQKDRSFELWTRLPSYKAAELGHGDYASEQCPCVSDVLREATWFISHGLNPTQEQIDEAGDLYQCPCGEDHSS